MDAYLFDLGNVMANFDFSICCRRLAEEMGNLTADMVYQTIVSGSLHEDLEIGRVSGEEFYASLLPRFPTGLPPLERFKEIWCDIFQENPGMVEMIKTLRSRARVILVSNTNQWHIEFLRARFGHILECFDALILSHEVGRRKPDIEMFRRAVEAAGTDPSHCIYFDDIEGHVIAARSIGIHAVHFRYL